MLTSLDMASLMDPSLSSSLQLSQVFVWVLVTTQSYICPKQTDCMNFHSSVTRAAQAAMIPERYSTSSKVVIRHLWLQKKELAGSLLYVQWHNPPAWLTVLRE